MHADINTLTADEMLALWSMFYIFLFLRASGKFSEFCYDQENDRLFIYWEQVYGGGCVVVGSNVMNEHQMNMHWMKYH